MAARRWASSRSRASSSSPARSSSAVRVRRASSRRRRTPLSRSARDSRVSRSASARVASSARSAAEAACSCAVSTTWPAQARACALSVTTSARASSVSASGSGVCARFDRALRTWLTRRSPAADRPRRSRAWSCIQSSMREKRSVAKSRCSTCWRSSVVARRKVWNLPCGSSTTCMNCSELIPSSVDSSWPTSGMRCETSRSSPSVRSTSRALACSRVVPSPRFFGRHHSGVRWMRRRRSPSVTSRTTSGRASAAAWWDRNDFTPRSPGTTPYSAKQTASSRLVLPAPVLPVMRKMPASLRESKSMTSVPA